MYLVSSLPSPGVINVGNGPHTRAANRHATPMQRSIAQVTCLWIGERKVRCGCQLGQRKPPTSQHAQPPFWGAPFCLRGPLHQLVMRRYRQSRGRPATCLTYRLAPQALESLHEGCPRPGTSHSCALHWFLSSSQTHRDKTRLPRWGSPRESQYEKWDDVP